MDFDEVRKRKEYAERKVKERHAALRKEAEERRKHTVEHRERVQSQLKREQILLQKRMQQLNEDEERKKATLAKQHEVTSRIAAITKSPKSFAFGSSTPRTLAYLDNLPKSEQQYDKKLRPIEGTSPVPSPVSTSPIAKSSRLLTTPQRAPPAAHRPAPTMTSMTSSMYVTSSAPPTRHAKSLVKPVTTSTSKRLSHAPSMMTQSVYTPTSRPATSSRMFTGRQNKGSTPSSGRPNAPPASTPSSARRSFDVRKPPMPRKSLATNPEMKKTGSGAHVQDVPAVNSVTLMAVNEISEATLVTPIAEESPNRDESPVESATEPVVERVCTPVADVTGTPKEVEEVDVATNAPLIEVFNSPEEEVISENVMQQEVAVSNEVLENVVEVADSRDLEEVTADNNLNVIQVDETVANVEKNSGTENFPHETIENVKEDVIIPEVVHKEEISLAHEETSSSHVGSSVNTSLADELSDIGVEQNKESHEQLTKSEVVELEYSIPTEPKLEAAPPVAAVNDLVDVFGNDFINENPAPHRINFDEDTDSGKASPTSSETSSTTDEMTPREEVKSVAPRVIPIVRSAEDIAKKEREAREQEERKARLAQILAKSRGMASPVTNTLPPTAAVINRPVDSTQSQVTSPPTPPSPLPVAAEQQTAVASSTSIASSSEEPAEKATNDAGGASDVLARVAAMTNLPSLQKILQRKQGSNPSLQTSESTGGEIY